MGRSGTGGGGRHRATGSKGAVQGFTRGTVRTGKRAGPSTGRGKAAPAGMRVNPKPWAWQGGWTPSLLISVEGVAWGLGEGVGLFFGGLELVWYWCRHWHQQGH